MAGASIVHVPIDQWENIASKSSVMALSVQTDKAKCVSVKPLTIQGRPALVTSVTYGGLEHSEVTAYWLVAESDYDGVVPSTTAWIDEQAIKDGSRRRGDSLGMNVLWKGQQVVCQEKIHVRMVLPARFTGLDAAMRKDAELLSRGGWCILPTKTQSPAVWWLMDGHPVVEYEGRHGSRIFALYYPSGRDIGCVTFSEGGDAAKRLLPARESVGHVMRAPPAKACSVAPAAPEIQFAFSF